MMFARNWPYAGNTVSLTYKMIGSSNDKDEDKDNAHLKFGRLEEKDFIGARKLLQQLGYDTTKDVHQQFKTKHKLK